MTATAAQQVTPQVFLGGTVANNQWRQKVIKDLEVAGIDPGLLFDVVLPPGTWNEEAQKVEDQVKSTAAVMLFYLADPQQDGNPISAYSLHEAQRALTVDPDRTFVIFDDTGLGEQTLKQSQKIYKDFTRWFPGARVYNDPAQGLSDLASIISARCSS